MPQTDVFISYSRTDAQYVRRLTAELEGRKKNVWVDFEDIAPASPWARVVTEAIGECDAFVFVISPDSVGSAQCQVELERAVSLRKRIVPLHLRDTEVKDGFAAFTIEGTAEGIEAGGKVTLTVTASGKFEIASRRVTELSWNRLSGVIPRYGSTSSQTESTSVLRAATSIT